MEKKNNEQLAKMWARKNDICGDTPWWDKNKTYYNLSVENVLSMAKFINTMNNK